ncbi:hypothetical protein D3C87_1022540 [compost metagenome]
MQQNVVLAVSYPIVNRESVKFVKEVINDNGTITFVAVDTADEAQHFGGEVGAVAEFLNYHVRATLENTWKFSYAAAKLVQSKEPV